MYDQNRVCALSPRFLSLYLRRLNLGGILKYTSPSCKLLISVSWREVLIQGVTPLAGWIPQSNCSGFVPQSNLRDSPKMKRMLFPSPRELYILAPLGFRCDEIHIADFLFDQETFQILSFFDVLKSKCDFCFFFFSLYTIYSNTPVFEIDIDLYMYYFACQILLSPTFYITLQSYLILQRIWMQTWHRRDGLCFCNSDAC